MSQFLLLYTFGPIQGFIAQARKTADLYAGSQILTELAKAVIDKVSEPQEVLFPNAKNTESLTNRIVVQVEGTEETVADLGRSLDSAVQDRWLAIAKESLGDAHFFKPAVQQQLKNHLETYWVAVPLGANYGESYALLNKYAAADKNQRTWSVEQNEDEAGRKCALDGVRNALFYGEGGNLRKRLVSSATELSGSSLQAGEALSAVSYVKRLYGQSLRPPFPSTATVALLHILEGADIRMEVAGFGREDGQAARTTMTENDQQYFLENHGTLNTDKRAWQNWKNRVDAAGLKSTPYYALLHFDGDDMGKWFSGENLPESKKKNLPDFHRQFTELLGKFSKQAAKYLNDNRSRGRTVYAGGDDFVGFVNLYELFNVLYELRAKFDAMVSKPLEKEFSLKETITFSAGVAIAHYKQPLGMVLDEARRMEKQAKNYEDKQGKKVKDAYGIGLMLRSGSTDEVVLPWQFEYQDARTYTATHIEDFVNYLTAEKLSSTFITNLELAERHYGGWPEQSDYLADQRNFFFSRSLTDDSRKDAAFGPDSVNRLLSSLDTSEKQQNLLNIIEFLGRHLGTFKPVV